MCCNGLKRKRHVHPDPRVEISATHLFSLSLAPKMPLRWYEAMQSDIRIRALGIDPGSARIGVAMSDDIGFMAHPLLTVKTVKDSPAKIAAIAEEKGSQVIVIGLPRNMNGSYGPAAEKSREFATAIIPLTTAHVILWDERLTTAMATKQLHLAGRNSKEQRKVIDQAAAVQILQDWLDANPGA